MDSRQAPDCQGLIGWGYREVARGHHVREGVLSYTIHNLFLATGEDIVAPTQIRFRTQEELERSLTDVGFRVEQVYGDWDRRPATASTDELIMVAVRL